MNTPSAPRKHHMSNLNIQSFADFHRIHQSNVKNNKESTPIPSSVDTRALQKDENDLHTLMERRLYLDWHVERALHSEQRPTLRVWTQKEFDQLLPTLLYTSDSVLRPCVRGGQCCSLTRFSDKIVLLREWLPPDEWTRFKETGILPKDAFPCIFCIGLSHGIPRTPDMSWALKYVQQ